MHVILLITFLLIIELLLLLLFFFLSLCVFSNVFQLNLFIFNSLSLKKKLKRTMSRTTHQDTNEPIDQPPIDQPPDDQPPIDQPIDQPPIDQPPMLRLYEGTYTGEEMIKYLWSEVHKKEEKIYELHKDRKSFDDDYALCTVMHFHQMFHLSSEAIARIRSDAVVGRNERWKQRRERFSAENKKRCSDWEAEKKDQERTLQWSLKINRDRVALWEKGTPRINMEANERVSNMCVQRHAPKMIKKDEDTAPFNGQR